MAEAAYDYFNGADLPSLPVATQAECLRSWARVEAKRVAAEAGLVGAFWASGGAAADGQKSMAAWLTRFARCTKPAARGMVAASFRVRERRHVDKALADGAISSSYARWIADAVGRFEAGDRDAVEEILVQAAASGAMVDDLEKIATAALRRLAPGGLGHTEAAAHADRGLTLSKTIGGVGRLNADLDAEATALTETVINALAVKAGPEDDRTARQRRHDALAEALRRLLASNLLPERGGAKPHVKVDMDLATLRALPGAKQAEDAWVARRAAELAARRVAGATTRELLTDTGPRPRPAPATGAEPEGDPQPGLPDDVGPGLEPGSELHPEPGPQPHPQPGPELHPQPGRGPGVRLGREAAPEPGVLGRAMRPARPRPGMDGACQPVLSGLDPGLGRGASLAGVGPISGNLAAALGCDSVLTPTVVAAVDRDALAQMTTTWLDAHGLRGQRRQPPSTSASSPPPDPIVDHSADDPAVFADRDDRGDGDDGDLGDPGDHNDRGDRDGTDDRDGGGPRVGGSATHVRLQETMLRWAIEALSGPGGLASYLRTGLLDGPLSTPSIVLDVGADGRTVPAPLERAVRRRDGRCRFPACDHPAELSQVHHIIPMSEGGPTELWNLVSLCSFHHLIAVHGWGWRLRLHPDGTTTATGPDGRVLHETDPPGDPPLRAA